jgi:hypothetical protein
VYNEAPELKLVAVLEFLTELMSDVFTPVTCYCASRYIWLGLRVLLYEINRCS